MTSSTTWHIVNTACTPSTYEPWSHLTPLPATVQGTHDALSTCQTGATVAILAWPPHEAADAFGTKLGQAGSIPDRLEGLDGPYSDDYANSDI